MEGKKMANIDEKKRTQAKTNWKKNFYTPVALMLATAIISLVVFCRLAARTDASPSQNVRSGVSYVSYAESGGGTDVTSEDERVAQ
jgi:hypothetical protein